MRRHHIWYLERGAVEGDAIKDHGVVCLLHAPHFDEGERCAQHNEGEREERMAKEREGEKEGERTMASKASWLPCNRKQSMRNRRTIRTKEGVRVCDFAAHASVPTFAVVHPHVAHDGSELRREICLKHRGLEELAKLPFVDLRVLREVSDVDPPRFERELRVQRRGVVGGAAR
eukprot:844547-Rhodomonas_salina.1